MGNGTCTSDISWFRSDSINQVVDNERWKIERSTRSLRDETRGLRRNLPYCDYDVCFLCFPNGRGIFLPTSVPEMFVALNSHSQLPQIGDLGGMTFKILPYYRYNRRTRIDHSKQGAPRFSLFLGNNSSKSVPRCIYLPTDKRIIVLREHNGHYLRHELKIQSPRSQKEHHKRIDRSVKIDWKDTNSVSPILQEKT